LKRPLSEHQVHTSLMRLWLNANPRRGLRGGQRFKQRKSYCLERQMLCICIKCGTGKRRHAAACRNCGFVPESMEEVAKSLYLSRDALTAEQRAQLPELAPADYSEERLLQIGSHLAAGVQYEYDQKRLGRFLAQGAAVRGVGGRQLLWWFIRFFGPAVAFIVSLLCLAWILRQR
jgi:hypothetical protein